MSKPKNHIQKGGKISDLKGKFNFVNPYQLHLNVYTNKTELNHIMPLPG